MTGKRCLAWGRKASVHVLPLLLWCACTLAVSAAPSEPVTLHDVVVTATRTGNARVDVSASTDLVEAESISAVNAISVDRVLRGMPGLDVQGSGYPGAPIKLSLRGLTEGYQTKRVLVLIDGRRVNDSFQGNSELSLIPADAIERIEVLKGPASALYGSNAEGGVLSITTRRGKTNAWTRIGLSAGDDDTYHARATHGWAHGPLDYFFSAGHVRTDGYLRNADGSNRDWDAYQVQGNIGWTLHDRAELRLFLGYYEGEGRDDNADRRVEKDWQQLVYSMETDAARDGQLRVQLYRNGQDDTYDWTYPGAGLYDTETTGAEVQQSLWLGEAHRVTLGADIRRDAVDIDEVLQAIDESSSTTGAYVQDEYHLGRLKVTAGLRLDHEQTFGSEWSPRVGVLWHLHEQAELYASVNRAHRAPALSDRHVRVTFNGLLFEGNPELEPETLTAYEAGLRYRIGARLDAELAGFYNDMQDAFDFVLDPSDGVFRNQNVTESHVSGLEASLRLDVGRGWYARANYSYMDGVYDVFPAMPLVDGNRIPYLAEHRAAAGLEYLAANGMTHAVMVRYASDRFGDAQNSSGSRMDDYVVSDLSSRLPLGERLMLTLAVDNLFDTSYREFPSYPQPGRTVMGGMELTF